jgi:putative ABC transport system permease protein
LTLVQLQPWDLAGAAALVVALALVALPLRLELSRSLLLSGLRMVIQLLLVGLVLKALFELRHPLWMALMAGVMWAVAAREVAARQERRLAGAWGYGLGAVAMFLSSFTLIVVALALIVRPDPWWTPQYAVPMLGMLLGNTMTGVALALDRLTQGAWEQRAQIEARLMLGYSAAQAIGDLRRRAARSGMMPTVNAMAAAGVVSLPGMMTGQILAGAPPVEAVKYQILIMFLIMAAVGVGTLAAVWLGARHLFDERDRLRLDRLRPV